MQSLNLQADDEPWQGTVCISFELTVLSGV